MSGIIRNLYVTANKIFPEARVLNRIWYSTTNNTVSEKQITSLLKRKFPNANIIVEDVSGGCGAMFEVFVESIEFKGLSIVKQHQAVTNTIKEEIKQIHGIRIRTKIP